MAELKNMSNNLLKQTKIAETSSVPQISKVDGDSRGAGQGSGVPNSGGATQWSGGPGSGGGNNRYGQRNQLTTEDRPRARDSEGHRSRQSEGK